MAATTRDTPDDPAFTTIGPDAHDYERYAQVYLEEDAILLYDRENEDAWITSDAGVAFTEVR